MNVIQTPLMQTNVPCPTMMARALKYPAIILANTLLFAAADHFGLAFAAVSAPMVLLTIALLALMERVEAFKSDWHQTSKEWVRDSIYFAQNAATGPLAKTLLVVTLAAVFGSPWQNGLPLVAQIALALVLIDLAGYLMHRAYHDVAWLWPIHAVHHMPDKVNAFNNNIAHFLNIALGTFAQLIPVMLLGFSEEAIVVAATYSTIHSFIIHANTPMAFGPLEGFIMTPAHHRLHHSTVAEDAGNHATIFTLWDRLGGTYVSPDTGTPREVGLFQGDEVPESFVGQLMHPIVRNRQSDHGETHA